MNIDAPASRDNTRKPSTTSTGTENSISAPSEDRTAGCRCRQQATAYCGEWEERDNKPGRQPNTTAEHSANPSGCLVLLGDVYLSVLPLFDHRSVVSVKHACLGMQVFNQLIIRLRVLNAGVHPDVRHERVDRHLISF